MSGNLETTPWARYFPPSVTPPLAGSSPTMLDAWDAHVTRRPDAPAVHYIDATLSCAEVDRAVEALACVLQDRGVTRGDRIAVDPQNDPQWLVTMLAAWKAGAVPVAVNPTLRHKELAHHLVTSGAKVLACLDHLYGDVAAEVVPGASVQSVIATHPPDMTPGPSLPASVASHVAGPQTFDGVLARRDVVRPQDGRRATAVDLAPDDIAILAYTSGTTGRSSTGSRT